MSNLKIERPYWGDIDKYGNVEVDINKLNAWFNTEVQPINELLAGGVEVYAQEPFDIQGAAYWNKPYGDLKYKALLINVQPIEEPTIQELMAQQLSVMTTFDETSAPYKVAKQEAIETLKKLKESLEQNR